MNERPKPEEIAAEFGSDGQNTIDRLAHHGYVIVHPDDVPEMAYSGPVDDGYVTGFNDCRDAILGAGVREGTG